MTALTRGRRWGGALAVAMMAVVVSSAPAGAQELSDAELIASARQACRDRDFNSFMSNFTRNTRVQAAFLASEIEVRSLAAPSRLVSTITAAGYGNAFAIAMVGYSWVDARTAGRQNPIDLALKWTELANDGQRIDYVRPAARGANRAGAYVFAFRNGCWQLVQDLR